MIIVWEASFNSDEPQDESQLQYQEILNSQGATASKSVYSCYLRIWDESYVPYDFIY